MYKLSLAAHIDQLSSCPLYPSRPPYPALLLASSLSLDIHKQSPSQSGLHFHPHCCMPGVKSAPQAPLC